MSVSYLVRYVGEPEDAEAFMEHYRTAHKQLMLRYPRIRGCKLHRPVAWNDPVAVKPDTIFVLAELIFDSIEDLNFALASEARQDSRKDFNNFPKIRNADIRHVAVETETLF
ncbi:MAG: EthD family reductase [Methylobacteriaceae bacterium]|nr:EthD family reductase [Methylobacteriaceae bacterium]